MIPSAPLPITDAKNSSKCGNPSHTVIGATSIYLWLSLKCCTTHKASNQLQGIKEGRRSYIVCCISLNIFQGVLGCRIRYIWTCPNSRQRCLTYSSSLPLLRNYPARTLRYKIESTNKKKEERAYHNSPSRKRSAGMESIISFGIRNSLPLRE